MLLAPLGPLGAARITLRLADIPEGCRVEMAEVVVEGPMRFVPARVQLAGIWPRNSECTRRLANLAEQRDPDEFDAGSESHSFGLPIPPPPGVGAS